ncbi:glycosomal membrane protein [Strigomonas culicis]|nr:glycosomal membrane protein [Strigomonas culicis]|eukprot:EPY31717.1 glycosomal membrane protein [Strigomonas culicis]
MSDKYRAVTRLSLLLNALSKKTLTTLSKPQGDLLLDRADQVAHFFHVFFVVFENTAVLASHGVYSGALTRLGGCAVTCWFYVLLTVILRNVYVLATKDKLTPDQRRKEQLSILKHGCFIIFSLTCLPQGGPKLLENVSGPLAPLHHALRLIAPKHLPLDDTYRGALGLVASLCDFA